MTHTTKREARKEARKSGDCMITETLSAEGHWVYKVMPPDTMNEDQIEAYIDGKLYWAKKNERNTRARRVY